MVKLIAASLLLGAVAVIVGMITYFHVVSPNKAQSPLILEGASALVEVGDGRPGSGSQLVIDDTGMVVVKWLMPDTRARMFPYLRLQFQDFSQGQSVTVFWKNAATQERLHRFRVPGKPGQVEWLPIFRSESWGGAITELGLIIQGEPQDAVTLETVELLPENAVNRFEMMLAHWSTSASWSHLSINHYWGTRYERMAAPQPVPVIALWLALSLVVYVFLLRRTAGFSWKVVAGIFLVCWLILDLRWQGKLLLQLRETQALYAGKSNAEKRGVGIDAVLFELVSEASDQMSSADTRVFVGSSDDYKGMRGAYYLYPHNVYWKRHGPELPSRKAIHPDDYILVLPPTELSFNSRENILETPGGDHIVVKLLLSRPAGALFRVL